jgi:KDO2-lipid IV(A) lauroyltransferase
VREHLEAGAVRLAFRVAGVLPRRSVAPVGRALGRAAFAAGVRRHVCMANLERAFASTHDLRARRRLAVAAYEHLGVALLETLRLPRLEPEERRALLALDGSAHVQAALAGGKGAIVASGHLGNWEVQGAALAAQGYPVTFVVQRLRNRRVDALIDALRRGIGIDVLPRGMALRRVGAALAANRLVFFMCDQDARRRGVFVPFFGVPASTPKGAAQLAVRFGVPFLPGFGWRLPDGSHRAVFHPPVPPPPGDEEMQVRFLLAAFNARLEAAVRGAPAQYWWAHRRWKTAPPSPLGARRAC